MGDGMLDAYEKERQYDAAVANLKKMEEQAFAENSEYKNLIDAYIAIIALIRQQCTILHDIQEKRHKILRAYWPERGGVAELEDLDAALGRNVISEWVLRDLIR